MENMEKVYLLLEQAGFSEDRHVDVSDILHMYEKYGYSYNVKQKEFIEKYAYLEIHYSHPYWKEDVVLRIDPIKAQREMEMDIVDDYNRFLKDKLLIIGDIAKENLTIFLSEAGFYIGTYDDCIINWGDNFEIMIKKLITGVRGDIKIMEE